MNVTCYILGIDMFRHIFNGYPCWGYDLFLIILLLLMTGLVICWAIIFTGLFHSLGKYVTIKKRSLKEWLFFAIFNIASFAGGVWVFSSIQEKHQEVQKELHFDEKDELKKISPIGCHWECLYTDRYIYVYTELL